MKITCEISISDRLLPNQSLQLKQKPIHAQLSIGCKPSSAAVTDSGPFLMVCTTKNRAGDKYLVKHNVLHVFNRFVHEGKLTIRIKKPELDFIISKCDPLELKCFYNVLKKAALGLELKKEHLSTLVPATCKEITKAPRKMVILSKRDYPLSTNFPKSLEQLTINTCNLKRFDPRILKLMNLTVLDLSQNKFSAIPEDVSKLGLKVLNLSNNQIQTINSSFAGGLLSRTLQVLDLSENLLEILPRNLIDFNCLVRIKLNRNKLRYLPFGLVSMPSLKFLQVCDNQLTALPPDFLTARLEELDLFGNSFTTNSTVNTDRLSLPSLVELSARAVKIHKLTYSPLDLPRELINYLSQGKPCSCGSYCFQSFAKVTLNFDLRRIAHTVVKLSSGGYSAAVDGFLCSRKCFNRHEKNNSTSRRR